MFSILVVIVVILLYWQGTRNFQYWKKRGVKHDQPLPFFGNTLRQMLQRISVAELITEKYNKYPDEICVGFFIGNNPALILKDPELIKHVMVTDFHHFYERGIILGKKGQEIFDPLMKNLFTVDGDVWKLLRQRMTPAFTSGKLKAMFPLIVERAEKLIEIADAVAETGAETDVRDLMARYTTDFIGACGFGVDADALNDENSTFRKLGRRIFTITLRDAIVIGLKVISPEMFNRFDFFAPEIIESTVGLVSSIMKERNFTASGRNDFIDLLLELRAKGNLVGESVERVRTDGVAERVEVELSEALLAAQAFIFFAAGFETSASSTSHTLHRLAYHPRVQRTVQQEIDRVLSAHGGRLSYDAIREMKYLEMVFKESMRMLPPLGFISRKCAKRYTLPSTDICIEEGVMVLVPTHALHHDERFFPSAHRFDPDRFHPANVDNIKKYTYLPFGEGPRSCIGERLGLMQSLAGLAALLSRFSVRPADCSREEPLIDPSSMVVQTVKGGLPLKLVARDKQSTIDCIA